MSNTYFAGAIVSTSVDGAVKSVLLHAVLGGPRSNFALTCYAERFAFPDRQNLAHAVESNATLLTGIASSRSPERGVKVAYMVFLALPLLIGSALISVKLSHVSPDPWANRGVVHWYQGAPKAVRMESGLPIPRELQGERSISRPSFPWAE
jgi:hypothetical protein